MNASKEVHRVERFTECRSYWIPLIDLLSILFVVSSSRMASSYRQEFELEKQNEGYISWSSAHQGYCSQQQDIPFSHTIPATTLQAYSPDVVPVRALERLQIHLFNHPP